MDSNHPLEFLYRLEGTTITIPQFSENGEPMPSQTWAIANKLSENPFQVTQELVDKGMGPSSTVAKFNCHSVDAPENLAYMRVYCQVPMVGTEFFSTRARGEQAVPEPRNRELEALKAFKRKNCTAVPRLLDYYEGVQDQEGFVPGGYVTYLIWEKVPGHCLSDEEYWNMNPDERASIRSMFREAWEELAPCGYEPSMMDLSAIIYDKDKGKVQICGFSRVSIIPPGEEVWSDVVYTVYGLVKPKGLYEDGWWKNLDNWYW
ncbi:hypothetical protein PITC_059240 [Penicillium italicum]|uniref:Uncharacterized protein n=1 Tax=Penicillium italicum TaxID=40296 RepID=A0A0A2LGH2_PENIT|nr:hypothetical protein PITC_059240 [Penicillium italicum]